MRVSPLVALLERLTTLGHTILGQACNDFKTIKNKQFMALTASHTNTYTDTYTDTSTDTDTDTQIHTYRHIQTHTDTYTHTYKHRH